jgi:hypothetical protein
MNQGHRTAEAGRYDIGQNLSGDHGAVAAMKGPEGRNIHIFDEPRG